jgi:hypothetical protein
MAVLNVKRFVGLLVVCSIAFALVAGVAYAATGVGSAEGQAQPAPGKPGVMRQYRDEIEAVTASTLGLSAEELRKELQSGKTLAAVAKAKGVSNQDLAKAIAKKTGEIADKLVAEGKITSEQAERIKSNAEPRALKRIENGRVRPAKARRR